jgi:hypothetical protein
VAEPLRFVAEPLRFVAEPLRFVAEPLRFEVEPLGFVVESFLYDFAFFRPMTGLFGQARAGDFRPVRFRQKIAGVETPAQLIRTL